MCCFKRIPQRSLNQSTGKRQCQCHTSCAMVVTFSAGPTDKIGLRMVGILKAMRAVDQNNLSDFKWSCPWIGSCSLFRDIILISRAQMQLCARDIMSPQNVCWALERTNPWSFPSCVLDSVRADKHRQFGACKYVCVQRNASRKWPMSSSSHYFTKHRYQT